MNSKEANCDPTIIYNTNTLLTLTKEELVEKIQKLQTQNSQLRNVIAKYTTIKCGNNYKVSQKPFDFNKCIFRHVLLKFMYVGWNYHGYVIQDTTNNTIEHYLFEALVKTCLIKDRTTSNYHRCGRTDKGVSAFGQVISIDLRSRLSKDQQHYVDKEINYCKLLNKVLPDTIQCIAWCPVEEEFSARFNCENRVYKYFFPKGDLNVQKMQQATQYMLGTHDFRNFCKMDVRNGVVKFVRTIIGADIVPITKPCDNDEYNFYVITIMGKAFLWHQIRCIMGILLLIGQGNESVEIIKELLDVDKNPRKPDYNMAHEVPLNLYHCEYNTDSEWVHDYAALNVVIRKLQMMWTQHSVKTMMLQYMLDDLNSIHFEEKKENKRVSYINCLLNGAKSKSYIPLLQRQKCESLESRINYYVKRQKLETFNETTIQS